MQQNDAREQAFERALRQSLKSATAMPPGPCVDAETIAAWADGTLSPMQSSAVESHLSSCPQCQAILAMFARTAPVAPPAVPLWRRWHMNWLVPLATAATAIAVWVAVPGREPALSIPDARQRAEVAQPASPAPRDQRDQNAPAQIAAPQAAPLADSPRAAAGPAPARAAGSAVDTLEREQVRQKAELQQRLGASADGARQEAFRARADKNIARDRESAEADLRAAAESAAPPPPPPAAAPAPAPPAPPLVAERRAVGGTAASPPPQTTPPAAPSAMAKASPPPLAEQASAARSAPAAAAAAAFVPAVFDVRSPTSATRWRIAIGKGVTFIGSGDAERPADIPAGTIVLAGSSPADAVCWMVGRAGAVYLTTDGPRFSRIPFPEAVDLVAVRATDTLNATVTSAAGRTYRTGDGGKSWQ